MSTTFQVTKLEDWQEVTAQILPLLQHNILLLKGNLGAGKTTFSQVLVKVLGSTNEVSSPTYAIVNEYDAPKGKIFHFDLYRLKKIEEAYDFGIEEYLDHAFLSIIEWPEIYEQELADLPHHEISITLQGDTREVIFL
jgi:tRNA threonylcarbamoyladenosine biosynthesis protein TsaE